jgi:lysyl-tRNA synthetase class 2
MEEINELIQERIKKLKKLQDAGIDPYGKPFTVKDSVAEIFNRYGQMSKEELGVRSENCTMAGRIVALRDFGKAAFAHVQDASGKIQVYFRKGCS